MLTSKLIFPFSLALFLAQAQPTGQFALTVDSIMRGPALVGFEPAQPRWSYDSQHIYFQWKRYTDKEAAPMDTYVANRDGSGLRKLTDAEVRALPAATGDTSKDKHSMVYASSGDLYLLDNTTGKIQQLTKTTEAEANPHFLPDDKRIWFTRGGNVYVMSLDTGMLVQMSDIRAAGAENAPATAGGRGGGRGQGQGQGGGRAQAARGGGRGGDQATTSASQDYLKKEQKELLEIVRARTEMRDEAEAKRKLEPAQRKPFNLTGTQTVRDLQLSPDEKYVFASVVEPSTAKPTIVPNYISDTGYVEDINGRSNVGDTQGNTRIAILNTETGDVTWVDHGQRKTASDAAPARGGAAQDRDVQLGMPLWSDDGKYAVIAGRSADYQGSLDLRARPYHRQDARFWCTITITPGSVVRAPTRSAGWSNSTDVYFQSERSGYSHLYAAGFMADGHAPLTLGDWEVLNVRLSRDKSKFYLTATKDGPSDQHLYEMGINGGVMTLLTKEPGKHPAVVSPDEQVLADVFSYSNKPTELFVRENKAGGSATRSPHRRRPILAIQVDGPAHRDGARARRREGTGALVQARKFQEGRPGRGFRPRLWILAECRP